MSDAIERAADAIAEAEAIFIGAGAGMGVDSGLPDFRGDTGFWRAYPPFQKLGLSFVDLANPRWFDQDPSLGWGFYGHRLHLYRDTRPHDGFSLMRDWATRKPGGYFAFTSNVDGHFQRAGYDDELLCECHGSIHHFQCSAPCDEAVWDADGIDIAIDEQFRAADPLPECACRRVARPNILMFGDMRWLEERSAQQTVRMRDWLHERAGERVVVVECGAGTAVPTVRWQCERVSAAFDAPLVRINPRESHGPERTISVAMGAREALERIGAILNRE